MIHHSNCGMEFYFPALYAGSVTVFLCGSVLFLVGALCSALLERGPSS